jgi:hypothetical protein
MKKIIWERGKEEINYERNKGSKERVRGTNI